MIDMNTPHTPLMPKATAIWLIHNTTLTFQQIADFCGLHWLEVQGIADGEVARGIRPLNPIYMKQVTAEEIRRCESDPNSRLQLSTPIESLQQNSTKSTKGKSKYSYVPLTLRKEKLNAVAWFLKACPEMDDKSIARLVHTTSKTVKDIRERSHWDIANIKAKDPVALGLCTQIDLDRAVETAKKLAIEKSNISPESPSE